MIRYLALILFAAAAVQAQTNDASAPRIPFVTNNVGTVNVPAKPIQPFQITAIWQNADNTVSFTASKPPCTGCPVALEISSDLVTWAEVYRFTYTGATNIDCLDQQAQGWTCGPNAADHGFYRLHAYVPDPPAPFPKSISIASVKP